MRSFLSEKILKSLYKHTPAWFSRMEIQVLLNTTARAFGVPKISLTGCTPEQALNLYGRFTRKCMKRSVINVKKIYAESYKTGRLVRIAAGLKRKKELEDLVFFLYKNIGITMTGNIPGKITVSKCYFSRIYTTEQCSIMSIMDSGIIAGICGGGQLKFTERITEGCGRCRACFRGGK